LRRCLKFSNRIAAGSDATIDAWQYVYRAGADGYEVAREALDGQLDEWVRLLDLA
jgi:uncharacterized protein (DUF934 family)